MMHTYLAPRGNISGERVREDDGGGDDYDGC